MTLHMTLFEFVPPDVMGHTFVTGRRALKSVI